MYKYIVSMIIVVRNAEKYIKQSLDSLLSQDFNKNEFEIIIIDGQSEDKTISIARKYLENLKISYKIIINEKKALAPGWNLAIKAAQGEYIVRVDAHANLLPDYIKKGIIRIENNNLLAAVGGVLETKSDTFIGKMISIVLSNPIGVGNSLFRIGVKVDTYSDTAVYAVYKKEVFNIIGGFDENILRNQDIDFHKKVLNAGYKLLTSPDMRAIYYNKTTIKKFLTQAFKNGYWATYSKGGHFRHFIPLFFIFFLISNLILSILINTNLFLVLFFIFYFLALSIAFIVKSAVFNFLKLLYVDILTFGLHICYGFGSLVGLIKKIFKGNL